MSGAVFLIRGAGMSAGAARVSEVEKAGFRIVKPCPPHSTQSGMQKPLHPCPPQVEMCFANPPTSPLQLNPSTPNHTLAPLRWRSFELILLPRSFKLNSPTRIPPTWNTATRNQPTPNQPHPATPTRTQPPSTPWSTPLPASGGAGDAVCRCRGRVHGRRVSGCECSRVCGSGGRGWMGGGHGCSSHFLPTCTGTH